MAAAFTSVSKSGFRCAKSQAFPSLPLTPLQPLVFDYRGHELKATVRLISTLDGTENQTGIVMEGTEVVWVKDPTSNIKLKNSSKRYVGPLHLIPVAHVSQRTNQRHPCTQL